MQTSQEISNLFKALCESKKEFVPLTKSKKGYGYMYVTLDAVIDMLNTVLPKHGINFVQFPSTIDGNYALTTRIFHESGEWMEDTVIFNMTEISKANDTQKLGASITYFRRYALSAIFGIASDEDVDGNIDMSIASQSQQTQRKQFNESRPNQNQPQQMRESAKVEPPRNQVQKTSFLSGEYKGIPLTSDEAINNEIKNIMDEVYINRHVIAEKQKIYIMNKLPDIPSKEDYLAFLKRISASIKKRIEEESNTDSEKKE